MAYGTANARLVAEPREQARAPGIGLPALEARAREDLARLNYPAAGWVLPVEGSDGRPALDALVIGAGMCGQTAAFHLLREGVRNIRVVDRAPPGWEGPWGTYARMETLRSPKHLTGPDGGVASLTFRAWHEAQHGPDSWPVLHKAGRLEWLDYLNWVRGVVGLEVENGTEVLSLAPAGDLIEAAIEGPRGTETAFARKVVLACGRDGSGAPRLPGFPSFDRAASHGRVFHSSDDIAFERFRGGRIAVLGAGASAFDNAAVALESGVGAVAMFARRPFLPQVNKSRWAAFPGFMRGFADLDDRRRWQFYAYIFDEQAPPPHESVLRCDRHPGFSLRLGEGWTDLSCDPEGVTITTAKGVHRADAAVVATGFDVDLARRRELAAFRDHILLWADRIGPAEAAAHPDPARFPYLGPGMEFLERRPGACPALRNLHAFNWGVTISHGALAGDIPGLSVGAARVAQAITRDLFVADADRHWANAQAFEEAELQPTRWYVPPELR